MQNTYTLRLVDQTKVPREDIILVVTLDGKPWKIEPGGPDYLCGHCGAVVVEGVPRNAALIAGGVLAVVCTVCGSKNRVPEIPARTN